LSVAVRRLSGLLFIIAAVAALYWPTVVSYSIAWTDFSNLGNTHGYLIVVMCLALLYLRREEFVAAAPRVSPLACVALAVLSIAWLVAYRASIQTLHQLLFPMVLWTAIYAALGRRMARSCLFAVGFLYFAVPLWGYIAAPLQALTIVVTRLILRVMGVPAHFDGIRVQIPEGTFVIEGGCSGVHFLVVGLAIAAYYGALHRDRLRNRVWLLLLAAVLALLTNWIRVSTIITAGHVTNMQSYLVRVSHYGFGWAVFAAAMTVFFLVASRIPPPLVDVAHVTAAARPDTRTWPPRLALPLVFVAMGLGPTLAWTAARRDAAAVAAPAFAQRVSGWDGPLAAASRWRPLFIGADWEIFGLYRRGSAEVEWYTADYVFQRQGKKLLGYDNSILGADAFAVLEEDVVTDGVHGFVDLRLRDAQGAQSLLWYVYEIGTREMTSGLRAQLWYGAASLAGPVDSRIIALRAKCDPDCAAARARLQLFAANICDNASRFDNCWRDRSHASDKL